jgi:hypothetical protein
MELLAPVLRAFGDQRLDAVLEHLERSASASAAFAIACCG